MKVNELVKEIMEEIDHATSDVIDGEPTICASRKGTIKIMLNRLVIVAKEEEK